MLVLVTKMARLAEVAQHELVPAEVLAQLVVLEE
jgi:hypothetical protein